MQLGAVALMLAETILREARAEFTHQSVARHFRDHARGRDAQAQAIAVDDRRLREREWEDRQSVDQDVLGQNRQATNRDPHRRVRGAEDVDPVDLERVDDPDRPHDLGVIREVAVNLFPQIGRELFGILQLPMPEPLRKNCGGSHDRASERAASGFVDPGDADHA